MRVMADRMDTAKDAPPVVKRGKGKEGADERAEQEERVPLELPERVEVEEKEDGGRV
jgi:hypothetical protein